jgi:hypothetical protein
MFPLKRLIILALALSLGLSLVGCGDDDNPLAPTPAPEEEPEIEIKTPTKFLANKVYCWRWPQFKPNGDAWDSFGGLAAHPAAKRPHLQTWRGLERKNFRQSRHRI